MLPTRSARHGTTTSPSPAPDLIDSTPRPPSTRTTSSTSSGGSQRLKPDSRSNVPTQRAEAVQVQCGVALDSFLPDSKEGSIKPRPVETMDGLAVPLPFTFTSTHFLNPLLACATATPSLPNLRHTATKFGGGWEASPARGWQWHRQEAGHSIPLPIPARGIGTGTADECAPTPRAPVDNLLARTAPVLFCPALFLLRGPIIRPLTGNFLVP
jgi:hypothetical protein